VDDKLFLPSNCTTIKFYDEFLVTLSRHYKRVPMVQPIISLEKCSFIDSAILPNLVLLGMYLMQFHKNKITLAIGRDYRLISYLQNSQFFRIAKPYYFYDSDLSETSMYDYRPEHRIDEYNHLSNNYYSLKDNKLRVDYRDSLFETLRYKTVPKNFKTIITDVLKDPDDIYNTLNIVTELISNGMLYSYSPTISSVQTNKYKTIISVSDIGIGFRKSLDQKEDFKTKQLSNMRLLKSKYKGIGKGLDDYLSIMDALVYSSNQNRSNLWALKNLITSNHGIFRIHCMSTQVVFTYSRCEKCHKEAKECTICLLDGYRTLKSVSPVRFYDVIYPGVHIEAEFDRLEV